MAFSDVPIYMRGNPLSPKRQVSVTPADSVTFSPPLDGIICTVAGDVVFICSGDVSATTLTMTAGQELARSIKNINSTGTTGTVKGLYSN